MVMKIIVLILFRKVTNWYNNFNLNLKQGLLVNMLAFRVTNFSYNTFFLPLHIHFKYFHVIAMSRYFLHLFVIIQTFYIPKNFKWFVYILWSVNTDPFKPPTAPHDQCAQYWKEGQDFVNAHHAINAHNIGRMSEFCERDQRAEFCQRAQYWNNVRIL